MELIITAASIVIIVIISLIIFKLTKNTSIDTTTIVKEELQRIERSIRDEISRTREENFKYFKGQREELSNSLKIFSDKIDDLLNRLIQTNEQKFDKLHDRVEKQLKEIQDNNSKKLEEMRQTVDEKLHSTLEKRLGDSFKLVSERLEIVHKGLGEMQNLATGVGDLKRVLTNVKTRGTWGEVQLGSLIEQVLTPDQYAKNVSTKKGSNAVVEFAIKMPGKNEDKEENVWIPIDAKFPLEDYQRLTEAQDTANPELVEAAAKSLEQRIKLEAKRISEKYIDPPHTTDFAIMFLPVEGLYAEILRRPGLFDSIQREYRVTMTGPTNFLAVLNSLQLGFRTLAIEKRSSEVRKLLAAVKTEFGKFGDVLEKTQEKLRQASESIDSAKVRTRAIERKLKDVQELPSSDAAKLID
ncbi:DNA recombination protein RmuC [Melioribacteraceae bacterium 4301-Me]|uniref:DNA recombination protein RmuC n=1 Tax=Pyranulibacter aquaticus TaxID=3163344 RepID=UPI003595B181